MLDQSFVITLLLSPVTWILALVAWCLVYVRKPKIPPTYKTFDKNHNRIGDFIKEGNNEDSDAEKRVTHLGARRVLAYAAAYGISGWPALR